MAEPHPPLPHQCAAARSGTGYLLPFPDPLTNPPPPLGEPTFSIGIVVLWWFFGPSPHGVPPLGLDKGSQMILMILMIHRQKKAKKRLAITPTVYSPHHMLPCLLISVLPPVCRWCPLVSVWKRSRKVGGVVVILVTLFSGRSKIYSNFYENFVWKIPLLTQ